MYQAGYAFGQIFAFLLFLVPSVFFLLTQQNTLKAIRRDNRRLRPGLVWLQLIPIFNLYWMFIVVTRIADSIYKEHSSLTDDSILGVADPDAAEGFGKRPTYRIGIAYCLLNLLIPLLIITIDMFTSTIVMIPTLYKMLGFVLGFVCLAVITCWIIYWVKLAGEKRKLQYLQA